VLLLLLLQARALWLVGACGTELAREQWIDAWGLSVQHIGARDLVVALQAVQAVLLLAIQILDEQAILDQVCFAGVVFYSESVCSEQFAALGWVFLRGLSVQHIRARDLVVALQAVQAVLQLAIQILDDQAILDQVCSLVSECFDLCALDFVVSVLIDAWGLSVQHNGARYLTMMWP
jgi:hypothetical protein